MIVPGSPHVMFGGVHPEITFLGTFNASGATFDIGPERPDRIVVIAGNRESDGAGQVTLSLDGVAPTYVYQGSTADPMALGYAVKPTGTTVLCGGNGSRSMAWLITGVTSLQRSITGSVSGAVATLAATMPGQEAAVIGISRTRSSAGLTATASASGTVNDPVLDYCYAIGSGNSQLTGAHGIAKGAGAGSLIITQSAAFSSGIAAGAVFV